MKCRWLIPEVVQSSAMDCGPAALKALLEGFGIHASYGRLREACQTDVDGTSIDALEETAAQMGLDASQIMAPADHLLLPEAGMLPALVIVRLPGGATHFVVIWRVMGGFAQVMDPAVGRRWVSVRRLREQLFRHTHPIPAPAWLSWARSGSFRKTILARTRRLGFSGAAMLDTALEQEDWRAVAALDAAVRMTEALAATGALQRGGKLEGLVARFAADPTKISEDYWSVRPDADDSQKVRFSAAVLVQARGRAREPVHVQNAALQAALDEKPPRPGLALLGQVWRGSRVSMSVASAALLLASAGTLFEAGVFRGLFDLGRDLRFAGQRWWASGALLAVLGVMWTLEVCISSLLARMGRKLEIGTRVAFLRKIALLGDRYFQSRLISDMAERGHSLQRLRELPELAAGFVRPVFEMLLTVAAVAWLYPPSQYPTAAGLTCMAAIAAIGIPLLAQPGLTVRDLRLRTHSGALSRFQLDALLGWTAIRAHGAERAIRREHASLLREWARAGFEWQRTVAVAEGVQLAITLAVIVALAFRNAAGSDTGALLLLVYWVLRLPSLGQEAAAVAWQYPARRNITLRLRELLDAPEEAECSASRLSHSPQPGVRLEFENVTVRTAGHTILHELNLVIEPGEHVGIVGPSGAGKSTLIGLLLGWHHAGEGTIRCDGVPLDPEIMRRQIAWVDPQVQIWNQSFLDNLRYGSSSSDLESAIHGANLKGVAARLPEGMETALGESGRLVSGGEGQRVRLGRALLQSAARLALLDEPARGLDRSSRRAVLETCREHWRRQTLLAVTHDVSDTLDLPRVLVVDQGRLVEDGNPRELAANPESRYRALLVAEEAVRRSLWSSSRWRRIRLGKGKLEEEKQREPAWT